MADIEQQAAKWFAATRRGLMTAEERDTFEIWSRRPENAAALAELWRIWGMLAPTAHDAAPASRTATLPWPARVAAMLSAASIAVAVLSRLDTAWWNTLDWWSR
jgi:transmembrane sensor